jgi:hypothetical protein
VAAGRLADGLRLPSTVRADGAGRSDGPPDGVVICGSAGRPGGVAASRAADCHGARDPADAQAGMSAGAGRAGVATGSAGRREVARVRARSGTCRADDCPPLPCAEIGSDCCGDKAPGSAWSGACGAGASAPLLLAELGAARRRDTPRRRAWSGTCGSGANEPLSWAEFGAAWRGDTARRSAWSGTCGSGASAPLPWAELGAAWRRSEARR